MSSEQAARRMRSERQQLAHAFERVELRRLRVELEGNADTMACGDVAHLTHTGGSLPNVAALSVDRAHHDRATPGPTAAFAAAPRNRAQ